MTEQEAVWSVPEPLSVHEVEVDSKSSILLRRHGNPDGIRLILSHGNGLAIDFYYPFWSLLTRDFDLIVYDLRNHGWNTVGDLENHSVPTLVSDHDRILVEIDELFGQKPQVGVFHSVSTLTPLISESKGSGYSALVLFDPPICKPGRNYFDFEEAAVRMSNSASRRTFQFKSKSSFTDLYRVFPTFKSAVPGVVDLLAATTLRESADGEGFELRCPREYEAQIIAYASVYGVFIDFSKIRCPVKVLGADPTVPSSYLPSLNLSDISNVDYDFLPESTHFLQLEHPEECAAIMREFIEAAVG
ncbi:MAG: alpha/beta hydrolase [bacterium]|nr:alpha/beta hydrolase [bacterium]